MIQLTVHSMQKMEHSASTDDVVVSFHTLGLGWCMVRLAAGSRPAKGRVYAQLERDREQNASASRNTGCNYSCCRYGMPADRQGAASDASNEPSSYAAK